jgi:hypothetical protein
MSSHPLTRRHGPRLWDARSYSCPHYHWTGSVACHVPCRLEVEACELREHAPTSLTSVSVVSAPPALQPKASCMARDTASPGMRYVRAQRAAAQATASSSLQHGTRQRAKSFRQTTALLCADQLAGQRAFPQTHHCLGRCTALHAQADQQAKAYPWPTAGTPETL